MSDTVNSAKTRLAKMHKAIREGGSVMYKRRIYNSIESLPSLAELADGDPAATEEVKTDLQAQIDDLQAQLKKLTPDAGTAAKPEDPKVQTPGGTKKTQGGAHGAATPPANQTPVPPVIDLSNADGKPEGDGDDKNPDDKPVQ